MKNGKVERQVWQMCRPVDIIDLVRFLAISESVLYSGYTGCPWTR